MSEQEFESHQASGSQSGEAATGWEDILGMLERVTEGTLTHITPQEILQEVVGRVREAMAVDSASILLLDDDGRELAVYAASGMHEPVDGRARVAMGRGAAGAIAATGRPLIINDLTQVEITDPSLRATGRSLVGAPLLHRERVMGVIYVVSGQQNRFTQADRRLLTVIARHVALAIAHAQLLEAERVARQEVAIATEQMQAMQAISDVALEHARLGDLLNSLLEQIQQTFAVDNVAILLPDAQAHELTLYNVHGCEEAVLGLVHVPMGQGVAGKIAATRKPLIVENLSTVPVANPFLQEHFHSLLGVPLLVGDRLIGVLHVDSIQPRHFTNTETALLEMVASRIALAIDRAHEYEGAQHKRLEAENRVTSLEEIARQMDEFVSIASHELRTPLTSLKTNIQMLDVWLNGRHAQHAEESPSDYFMRAAEAMQSLVRRSNQSIARLDRLIEELLDASRIHEQRLDMSPERLDLAQIVRDAVAEQREAHPDRVLSLEVPPNRHITVLADADRISQVLANYVANGLKYSRRDQPVTIEVVVVGDWARVAVRDQGPGIAHEEHEHIWERFYRVKGISHLSGSKVGLGLGLYISRDIIARHHGEVGVISAPGGGSTFWFTLPLAPTEAMGAKGTAERETENGTHSDCG